MVEERFARVVAAFHLLKPGPLTVWGYFRRPQSEALQLQGNGISHLPSVPENSYFLAQDDVARLRTHLAALASTVHPTIDFALGRLAAISLRRDARDKIVDAVIGLEALLLSEQASDKYKGELRFRFAINLGVLENGYEARRQAFLQGKSLYDERSRLAHGGKSQGTVKFGDARISALDFASAAEETLRRVIVRFLPWAKTPPFLDPEFWTSRYFGSSAQKAGTVD